MKGKGRAINEVDFSKEDGDNESFMEFVEYEYYSSSHGGSPSDHQEIDRIDIHYGMEQNIPELQAKLEIPWMWDKNKRVQHVADARQILTRPASGRSRKISKHCLPRVIILRTEVYLLMDGGALFSMVRVRYLTEIFPNWRYHALPCSNSTFLRCGS